MTQNLVQVDDDAWIDPSTVKGVKHWPPTPSIVYPDKMSPDNTVICHQNGTYTVSYWPFERIRKILGLTDRTWVYDLWEKSA